MGKDKIVGIFSIQTPQELLRKLEADFARCEENWADAHAAWNFFVTAYHLAEWVLVARHSDPKVEKALGRLCNNDNYWKACRYFANSAKHHALSDPEKQLADHTNTTFVTSLVPRDGASDPSSKPSHKEFQVRIDGRTYRASELGEPIMRKARKLVNSPPQ